jgi:integrase
MAFTPEQVRQLIRESGDKQQWHADGRSLFLVTRRGRGFWVLHFRDPREGGAIRNTSLGTADAMSAAAARKAARSLITALDEGRPVAIGARKAKGELFGTCATSWLENHADEWTPRTRADNKALFSRYIPADFNARPVTAITPDHIADALRPIWNGPGNNRGSRLRRLMFGVLAAKNVHPNPARWNDGPLPNLLSRKRAAVKHREAMPWQDVPAFVKLLGDSVEDRAGRFAILTCVRRKEALGAPWREFDLKARVWTIPGVRMKKPGGKVPPPHSVPLTDAAIACLGKPDKPDELVFASTRTGGMLGNKACDKEWHNLAPYTLHGFRTSMSTWAEEKGFSPNVIEAALAHAKGNATTQAYLRSELFEARRKLMDEWAAYAIAQLGKLMFYH